MAMIVKSKSCSALCPEDITYGRDISYGTYGIIKRGYYFEDGKKIDCVLKVVDTHEFFTEKDLIREAKLINEVDHINVLKIHAYYVFKTFKFTNSVEKTQGHLILELCKEKNLQWVIHNMKLKPCEKLDYSIQIAKGFRELHIKNIIHRDLKPANILIGFDDHLKICDFGNAKKRNMINGSLSGTPEYIDPQIIEYIEEEEEINVDPRKYDIYSFGITLWEIWTQKYPYYKFKMKFKMNELQLITRIYKGNIRPNIKDLIGCPISIIELIKKCWDKDSNERPESFDVILKILKNVKLS